MPISINEFPDMPILKYDEARSQIVSGDILLCSGTSPFSQLIQGFTGSIWSHVGFILWHKEIDRLFVIESVESIGVRAVPLSFYTNNYNGKGKPYAGKMLIARHDEFKHAHIEKIAKKSVDLLGHQYDSKEIMKITTRIALSRFAGEKDCRYPEPDGEYICSEYAYECFSSVGLYIEHDCRGFVTPADFAKTKEVNAVFGLE